MINQKITLTDPLEENYFYKEAMKTLRTNLQFSGKNYKTIVVTSTQPGEGKSNICFHLAAEMAKTGKKVLLVGMRICEDLLTFPDMRYRKK